MSAFDGLLDFISVELLGCALPRQKRPTAVIEQPRIDPATTWSNGYTEPRYGESQIAVPQLEVEQPL